MKILHIIPSINKNYGGPTFTVFSYVINLRKLGIEAEILTSNIFNENKELEINKLNFIENTPVHIFKSFVTKKKKIYEFGFSLSLYNWLKNNIKNYDLIHIYSLFRFSTSISMYLAIKNKIPYILYPAGGFDIENYRSNSLIKKIYINLIDKKMMRNASLFHFNSNKELEEAKLSKFKFKSLVLPIGVSIPNYEVIDIKQNNKKEKIINFLFLARIHPIKRLEIILNAFKKINNKYKLKNWCLHVVGSGEKEYITSLKRIVDQENISKNIIWHGFLEKEKKENIFKKCDWFLNTSKSESFGISIVEALAYGLPVLITKQIPFANTIKIKKAGFIINEKPKNLADQIKNNFMKKPSKEEINNAYNFAKENFCEYEISKKLKNEYLKICNSN